MAQKSTTRARYGFNQDDRERLVRVEEHLKAVTKEQGRHAREDRKNFAGLRHDAAADRKRITVIEQKEVTDLKRSKATVRDWLTRASFVALPILMGLAITHCH